MDLFRAHVLVCGGTGCSSSGSAELIKRFEEQIAKNGLDKEVKVVRTGCFGLCEAGPVVIVYPEGTFYSRIQVPMMWTKSFPSTCSRAASCSIWSTRKRPIEEQHVKALDDMDFYRPADAPCAAQLRRDRSRKTSMNTSPLTATRRWPRCSPK